MKKNFSAFLFILTSCSLSITAKAQINSEYDQLVYVNKEWKDQADADLQLKLNAVRSLTEQQVVRFHLTQTEKLLRKRDVSKTSPALQQSRARNFAYLKVLYVKVEQASPLRLLQNIVASELRYRIASGMNGSKLQIYDMNGRSVYKTDTKEGLRHINVSA
jgi:hypothetical protein